MNSILLPLFSDGEQLNCPKRTAFMNTFTFQPFPSFSSSPSSSALHQPTLLFLPLIQSLPRAAAPTSHRHPRLRSARRAKAEGRWHTRVRVVLVCARAFGVRSACKPSPPDFYVFTPHHFKSFLSPSTSATPPILVSLGGVCNYKLLSIFPSHTTTLWRELGWCHYLQ